MNKADRVTSIKEAAKVLIPGNTIARRQLENLRGKLCSADQMVFGCRLRPALATLQLNTRPTNSMDGKLKGFKTSWFDNCVPRPLGCKESGTIRVYTDGACEECGELVSCGAIRIR